MSTELGQAQATTETVVQAMASQVCSLAIEARDIAGRIGSLKYRLLGHETVSEDQPNAPEPVRQDFEELDHQVGRLRLALADIKDGLADLEKL